jgi:transcriptional regulator with XRE-family HTH domain
MVTNMQLRAARGLLQWTQNDLARESRVSHTTIRNFENGKTSPQPATLTVLRQTLERHGVEFTADGRGVRLNPERPRRK